MRPVRRDPTGERGPTRGQAAGPAWRQSGHGLHVPASVPLTVEQRIFEVAARLPVGAMVTGWAALRMAGARWFEGLEADRRTPAPVPVLLHHRQRIRSAGVLVERTRGRLPEPQTRYGVPCAPTERALLHELGRCRDARRAGVMVDMSLAAQAVDLATLSALVAGRRRVPAVVAHAVARASPHCRSPKESEMLQVWEDDLGFPRPLVNHEVLDTSGRRLAVVDLLDPEAGVFGEYNGSAHRSRERQRRDEARAADLRGVGLEPFVLVAGDATEVWRERMRAARSRALWLPPDLRRWRVGRHVPAPPLPGVADEDEAALAAIMVEHHRSLE